MTKSTQRLTALLLAVVLLTACSTPTPIPATQTSHPPTHTAEPPTEAPPPTSTMTLTPPPSTDTPTWTPAFSPTQTDTETPTPTITLTPGPRKAFIPLPGATGDTVNIYFILPNVNVNTCDDRVIAISSGVQKDGDVEKDVKAGLVKLFSYKDAFYGDLYNPLYASRLHVQKVSFNRAKGEMSVWISGTYKPTGNPCDSGRVRNQIWNTARQYGGIKATTIYLNKGLFGDHLESR